ncbi:glycosyltransferase [Shewanella glacialipiscicola]|uniref:glycosyltransferase family 2 protein n=1 Tax=Shewanella glacialipiscicola TaxID=614069 RepID=UPI0021DABCDC|nr:glycosyltransferase [Shewanella glacialipiscicola]MCU7995607.1 glycosyltransferase [Shewanella glacialipiscicola]MCU8026854.1 glycosyltransferase [Shewanella glacialipiscicola]
MKLTNIHPKLSVCVVTYNQDKYIEQCLMSIIEQKTDFDFEIIVGDDCSTDNTARIVHSLCEKYPTLIKLLCYEKNVGAAQNFLNVHNSARGKYIAHIDGDDYMLPDKLQSQMDFMESNPNCNLSWHRMLVDFGDELKCDLFDIKNIPNGGFKRSDILKFITLGMNSSKMYRSGTFDFLRPDFPMLDYFANVEQIGDGRANFVSDKPLGVYRAGIGIAKGDFKVKVALNKSFRYFLAKYPVYRQEINQAVLVLLIAAIKNLRYKEIKLFFWTYIYSFNIISHFSLFQDLKFIKTLRLP